VVAALLLAAAAFAAVDLSGLVDKVYNTSSPLDRFAPTYIFEVDGCRVLVYVVNSTLKNSPLTNRTYDEVYYSRNATLRPLTSAEAERLLNALFQALGPSAEAWVVVWTKYASQPDVWSYRILHVETRNATQLAEEASRDVEADFYLGAADAREALLKKYETSKGAAAEVAYIYQVEWRRGDVAVSFNAIRQPA